MKVLAIDPGMDKCGIAVVEAVEAASGDSGLGTRVLHREITARDGLIIKVGALVTLYVPTAMVVGNGTGSGDILRELRSAFAREAGLPEVHLVDEYRSSEEARVRYLADHKPRGILRFLPSSLRYPDAPYDDYVAVILAERFIRGSHPEMIS